MATVKRSIGIDISPTTLCAVQMLRTADAFCVEKVFSTHKRRSTDLPAGVIKALVDEHGFDGKADVAIAVPDDCVYFRTIESSSAADTEALLNDSVRLAQLFPLAPEQIVAQAYLGLTAADAKLTVLIAGCRRQVLQQRQQYVSAARMRLKLADATICAVYSTVLVNHPQSRDSKAIIVLLRPPCITLGVTENGCILSARNIQVGADSDFQQDLGNCPAVESVIREARTTWQKAFSQPLGVDAELYLIAEAGIEIQAKSAIEEKLDCKVHIVNPYALVQAPPQEQNAEMVHVAEGLALRLLAPELTTGLNFQQAPGVTAPRLNPKKELLTIGVLAGAAVAVLLAGFFLRLSALEKEHTVIKEQTEEIFRKTLPNEKNIVNPVAQLETQLKQLHSECALYGRPGGEQAGVLDVLTLLSNSLTAATDISLDTMRISTTNARVTGQSGSFEAVYNWQKKLQAMPQFPVVQVDDIHKEQENSVSFTVVISLVTEQGK